MSTIQITQRAPKSTHRIGDLIDGEIELELDHDTHAHALEVALHLTTQGKEQPRELQLAVSCLAAEVLFPAGSHRVPFSICIPAAQPTYQGELLQITWKVQASLHAHGASSSLQGSLPLTVEPSARPDAALVTRETLDGVLDHESSVGPPIALIFQVTAIVLLMSAPCMGLTLWEMSPLALGASLLGVPFLLLGWRHARRCKILSPPHIRLEASVLEPGERTMCTITLSTLAALNLEELTLTLEATEQAMKAHGKRALRHERTSYTHTVCLARDVVLQPDEPTSFSAEVALPDDAPLTFVEDREAIIWSLNANLTQRDGLAWSWALPITVQSDSQLTF